MRAILAFLLLSSFIYANDFQQAIDNTCIIEFKDDFSVIGKMTGAVFAEDKECYYVVSAGHGPKQDYCNGLFFRNGKPIDIIMSRYLTYDLKESNSFPDPDDYRICRFYKIAAKEKGLEFDIIPLRPEKPVIENVYSVCYRHNCLCLTQYELQAVGDKCIFISPKPVPGNSGAPVFNSNFTQIIGIQIASDGLCTTSEFILNHYENTIRKPTTQN